MRRDAAALERCYQRQLRRTPALTGTIDVRFAVDASGAVPAVRATGVDGDLDACVDATIKHITFPRPHAGTGAQVRYPITFRMASDPGVVHPTAGADVTDPTPDPGVVHPGGPGLAGVRWADDDDPATAAWSSR